MKDLGVVESIRSALNIVQIIGEVVPLEKRGHNYFGCCPFHQEKTPSLSVSSEKQLFHCFGCKVGGDLFKFCTLYYKWDFPQALEELARRAGIHYEKTNRSFEVGKQAQQVLEAAAEFFEMNLNSPQGELAQIYLQTRKVPQELWKTFRIGFHPGTYDGLATYLDKKSLDRDIAAQLGLLGKSKQGLWIDRFRGRLIFSISDERGYIRGFGARSLGDEQPKYINSPNSPQFDKGRLLYGMHLALESLRKKDYLVVVEGYLDVIALYEYGIRNVVCPMGTALTRDQIRLMKRWTHRIVCLFDGDDAGIKATQRNLESFLEEGMEAKVACLSGAKDPEAFLHGELAEDQKKRELTKVFKSSVFALDFLIQKSILVESDSIQRAKKLRALFQLLDRVPDPIERAMLKKDLVTKFNLPPEVLESSQSSGQTRPLAPAKPEIRPVEPGNMIYEREILRFLVLWGGIENFDLTDLKPYLSFSSKWSKLLEDFVEKGKTSREISELHWLDDLDANFQSEFREWVLQEESVDHNKLSEIFKDLKKRLRAQYFKQQSFRLQMEIVDAEKTGDTESLRRLLIEKQDLARLLKTLEE